MIGTDTAEAQRGTFRVNQVFRKLGGGWSAGYHWRTPAPKVDYYNPYSRHNSSLKIGGIPQGSASYLARLGDVSQNHQPVEINSFDAIGNYDESSSYNFMPTVEYSVAPGVMPPNVVTSEVIEQETQPKVDYRHGPENTGGPQKSILNRNSGNPSIDKQPSPSDQPVDDDGVSLWQSFDDLESLGRPALSGRGR